MKQKVSDYIADYIAEWGIRDVFTVTGGGAMHMNDAFGHHPKLHCTYQHHEQACAMAAEAYARIDNRMAAVCVTTGPGATNAITGVLGGWMDSIPMLVFSVHFHQCHSGSYNCPLPSPDTENRSVQIPGDSR